MCYDKAKSLSCLVLGIRTLSLSRCFLFAIREKKKVVFGLQCCDIGLKKYFFLHPDKILKTLLEDQPLFSMLFADSYQLPDAAFCDYQKFRTWSDCLYERAAEAPVLLNIISSAFAKSPDGADGIYPHEFIRMILDEFSDSSLTKAVAISHLNAYGARVVLDGLYESQMAETMQQRANDMELNYPQTAKILRCIANDYASEAKRDRQYAEMGHFR